MRNVPSADTRTSRRTTVASKATTHTWPAVAAGTFSTRPSIAPPRVTAMSTAFVRSLSVTVTGPTTVGGPAVPSYTKYQGPNHGPGLRFSSAKVPSGFTSACTNS